jgi:AcrR family transcriptional regulator
MMSARPRDRILTTATELFRSEGIGAVGVNRIIDQADVAPMTLYRQFGGKDALVAATLEQWSTQWLHRLQDAMDRRGDDPSDRFDGLWDELDAWFAEDDFRGSFVANAATELRSEPDHPAQVKIVQHRQTLRQLLEDLAKSAGAHDPTVLAAQLQVLGGGGSPPRPLPPPPPTTPQLGFLVDSPLSSSAAPRTPAAATGARTLARAAVKAASGS